MLYTRKFGYASTMVLNTGVESVGRWKPASEGNPMRAPAPSSPGSQSSIAKRCALAGLSFLLPAVLTWRVVSGGVRKRRHLGRLISALPMIALLESIWSIGEFVGYVTGRAGGPRASAQASVA